MSDAAGEGLLRSARRAFALDALSLAAIAFLSALPYLGSLGFYSDDWALLAGFKANEQTGGFWGAVLADLPERPVQALYHALLFKLFGLTPLGYHLVNTAVLAACAVLLYLLLLRLRMERPAAFATALLFLLLPQLSTIRVWYAASHVTLSLAFALVSMLCQLHYAAVRQWWWLTAGAAAALLSVGTYELFTPLIAGFALATGLFAWRRSGANPRHLAGALLLLALLLATAAYKLLYSFRSAGADDPQRYALGLRQLFRIDYDPRVDSGLNIFAALRTYFWAPLAGWRSGAEALVTGSAGFAVVLLSLVVAGVGWWRIRTARGLRGDRRRLLLLGFVAFLLGNAIFLVVPAVVFTVTGIGNRFQVAAALGVAAIYAAAFLLLARIGGRYGGLVFASLVALASAAALARLAAIEAYWAHAPALQADLLRAARSDLRQLPTGSTVILDGVCPYHGPAIVFETYWDIGGALNLVLDRPISADVVSPRMQVTPTGLKTSIYKQPAFYAFGPRLFAYNPAAHRLFALTDAAAADRYFRWRTPLRCQGFVARGVEV